MNTVQTLTSSLPSCLPQAPLAAAARAGGGEYISFRLGNEEYGIHTLCVQEIRSYEAPTRIANAPAALCGIIDLRGVIVPIFDLRIQLGCARATYDASTIVIVLSLPQRVVGVVVDAVTEVLQLDAGDIRPAPELNSLSPAARYITGVGTFDSRMLILLDIERWMQRDDSALLSLH